MVIKHVNVSKYLIAPNGDIYCEPKMDRKGRIMLEELDDSGQNIWRFTHQLEKKDTPIYIDKRIGDIITFSLDKLDEKASGEEIRKRFALSCKVEEAMKNGGILKIEPKDIKIIEATLESIKNPLFNFRVQEALDIAEVDKGE